jgi:hypothetical protein
MRLSESEIIAGLQHPSLFVREDAAIYLEACGRTQADITPHLIAAIERFGWKDSLEYPHRVADFELDETTLPWALNEIQRHSGESELHMSIRWHLTDMVSNAPIAILRSQLANILQHDIFQEQCIKMRGYWRTAAELIQLRCDLWEKSPDECWALLNEHCRAVAEVETFAEANVPYLKLLVERIALAGQAFAREILEVLEKPPQHLQKYEEWLGGAMIQLAGCVRLESAIPLVYSRFDVDWDWYNEEIMKALIKIGTPEVTALVSDKYTGSLSHVQIYSQGVLESVHHDNSVSDILRLIPHEHDEGFRGQLGVALASHFDDAAIEPALAIYEENPNDAERFYIIKRLFAHARLAKIELPQLDQWEEMLESDRKRFGSNSKDVSKILESLSSDDDGEWLEDEFWDDEDLPLSDGFATSGNQGYSPKLEPIVRESRIGRNERCPCGSGKKYKNCCLRNAPK